jgi:hypothetical protein
MKLPEDTERLKIYLGYGFTLLGAQFILVMAIALGKVESETSSGLPIVLGSLGTMGGGFVGWAFGRQQSA